jgi:steroid 5-alpha reductase family enzyme
MPREIALADALVPSILLVYLGCLLVLWVIDTIVGRYGLYRYVWHPSLFRVALFFCLFGAVGLLLYP